MKNFKMFKSILDLCDVVSHVVYCHDDGTMFIGAEPNSNEYWIPSTKISFGGGWIDQSFKDMDEIFSTLFQGVKLFKLYKVWVPQHVQLFIYHCIFGVTISGEQKRKVKSTYGRFRGKIIWANESELRKMLQQDSLRSPELLDFLRTYKSLSPNVLHEGTIVNITLPAEFLTYGGFVEFTEHAIITSNAGSTYEQLLESACFTKDEPRSWPMGVFLQNMNMIRKEMSRNFWCDVLRQIDLFQWIRNCFLCSLNIQISLLKEYVYLCFPALFMCQQVFCRFVGELGWARNESPYLFRAADVSSRYGISFKEFLIILAAIEPTTSHGGSSAEIRCRYMFRFFDRDGDSTLNYSEYRVLVAAIRRNKKQLIDPISVNQETETLFKAMGLPPETGNISLADFLQAIGTLKIRGTSQLLRSPIGIQQYLYTLQGRGKPAIQTVFKTMEINNQLAKQSMTRHKDNYSIGTHLVNIQKSGTVITFEKVNGTQLFSASSTQQSIYKNSSKRVSQEMFAELSLSNETISSLRYLIQNNKHLKALNKGAKGKEAFEYSWGTLDYAHFGKNFLLICGQVKEIFKSETRLIDVQAPAYILGDLHGNFNSLMYFEKVLWHLGIGLCPSNIVFLGDYVDRGPHSMEVIAYLFSYKIEAPRKLTLLRGNHEIRDIQKLFTFYAECLLKFGEKLGMEVWNAINSAFDAMPLAATIDGRIFCCHGGIPPPWLCPTTAAINSVPCPLSNPDEQSALAWELMWNDPIRIKPTSEEIYLELQANDGFAANSRRGTGHVFSPEALERFLTTNHYSHMIRAHEVAVAGFALLHKGKLLTVFSSAKYCGGTNEAACVLVDQGKLRILKIDAT